LRIEVTGRKVRFFVDATEVGSTEAPAGTETDCEDFVFVVDDGKAEVTSFAVRRR
jgi:hypothetical protein